MSVAVSNSPVFSPSSSLFCNMTSIITASPEALTLPLSHLKPSPCSSSSSAPSSPSSPFRLRKDEKERIETLGGYVDFCHGVWRIQGSLAVSRGIGDRHLKQWVIAEPDTKVLRIIPEYEFLILASDGLWDKVSNQEAVDIARPLCIDTPQPLTACKMLADLSASRGSSDDISVMLIQLGRYI
ncbi:putative protein phosphatase 2c 25 [Quercus suber]|uniref:PPM-type phosphatase domain-containing protein n=1 Tax=Quercus suber TaxID=58331 RepID=A0AAW0ICJ0_QUESU